MTPLALAPIEPPACELELVTPRLPEPPVAVQWGAPERRAQHVAFIGGPALPHLRVRDALALVQTAREGADL